VEKRWPERVLRYVRIVEVAGSSPVTSTGSLPKSQRFGAVLAAEALFFRVRSTSTRSRLSGSLRNAVQSSTADPVASRRGGHPPAWPRGGSQPTSGHQKWLMLFTRWEGGFPFVTGLVEVGL